MVPYWSLEMFFISTWMFGFFLFHRATTWSMPGTVFQYWRVTLPWAGSQAEADVAPVGAGEEHAESAATLAAAVTTAPTRRMRVTVLLMLPSGLRRRWTGRRRHLSGGGLGRPDGRNGQGATVSVQAPSAMAG